MAYIHWIIAAVLILSRECVRTSGNAAVSHGTSPLPFFKITNRDFLNTQITRICLLARLNATISLTYSDGTASHTVHIAVPQNALTSGSFCDYDFQSLLRLNFSGLTFWMYFNRSRVKPVSAQNQYCLRCDIGNWNIINMTVEVANVTSTFHSTLGAHLPATEIVAGATAMPVNSGPMYYGGVSVQRSYRCNTAALEVPLHLTKSRDLLTNASTITSWSSTLTFYSIEVEPFLVTEPLHVGAEPTFKDPLLCSEVTVFHVLVILLPIVYFFIFVVICRMREKYGCPPDFKNGAQKKKLVNDDDTTKQPFSSSSVPPPDQGKKNILITVTDPDNTQSSMV